MSGTIFNSSGRESNKSIQFGSSSEEDLDGIVDVIVEAFITQEPLNRSITLQGIREDLDYKAIFGQKVQPMVGNGYTVVAKLDNRNVIGVGLISDVKTREQYCSEEIGNYAQTRQLLRQLRDQRTEELPDKFIHLKLLAVYNEYQNMGVCGKMLDWAIERGRENGVGAIVTEATSLYSQKLFSRRKFKCIGEIVYEEYKNSEGEVIFKHMHPHISAKLMTLNLQ